MGKVNLYFSKYFFFLVFVFALFSPSKDRRSRVFDYYSETRKRRKCFGGYLLFVGVTARQIVYLHLVVAKASIFRLFFQTSTRKKKKTKKKGGGEGLHSKVWNDQIRSTSTTLYTI